MKQSRILLSLAVLALTACHPNTTDDANDAGGTGSAELARSVVGVRMLSTDTPYEGLGNYLAEDLVRGTFKLDEKTELEETTTHEGGVFSWGKNEVVVSFGSARPYQSIYKAEYAFNKMYQPGAAPVAHMHEAPENEATSGSESEAISGPKTEGTGAEHPAESPTSLVARNDSSAANGVKLAPSPSVSGVEAKAAHLTPPAKSTGKFVAYPGLGDKAVWDPTSRTMHVLLNNHILNVQVKTADTPAMAQQRAAILANVIFDEVVGDHYTD